MLFDTWSGLARVVIVGTLSYVWLVLLLRVSGKRTLSKLNAFDLVVTVALGSTLATVLLDNSIALVEGFVALGLLIGLQYAIAWLSVRSQRFQGLVKAEPSLLFYRGQFLSSTMHAERITREEILAAMRTSGSRSALETGAVVLETDGSLTVVADAPADAGSELLATVAKRQG